LIIWWKEAFFNCLHFKLWNPSPIWSNGGIRCTQRRHSK